MILRMEEKRQSQMQQQRGEVARLRNRKKGETEAKKLVCTITYDGGEGSSRGGQLKALSE